MNKSKYPISLTGIQCIGPCVKPGNTILHPITLQKIRINDKYKYSACPINKIENPNKLKKHNKILNDIFDSEDYNDYNKQLLAPCNNDNKNNDNKNNDKLFKNNNLYLLPDINIDCGKFLKMFYKIYSIENTIEYISNNSNIPKTTKIRLINCSWKEYGLIKENITDIFIYFYYDYIHNYWIKKFYKYLGNYILYDKNKIILKKNNEIDINVNEKIKYIKDNIYTFETVKKIMLNFIDEYKEKWDEIISHHKKIKKLFISYGLKIVKT